MQNLFNNLLSPQDTNPVGIIEKSGNIIFSGPHNGKAVPLSLKPNMGMNKEWFNNSHDALDIYMDEVFKAIDLDEKFNNTSLIWGNYSRLVCDLNSAPGYSIKLRSSEDFDIKIPENAKDRCCIKQRTRRLEEIYHTYHDAKKQLIEKVRKKHGNSILLDLHSFSPTWDQKKRDVEIGTIRCEKTPLSKAFEQFLREEQSCFKFVSGEPYRVADRPSNIAPLITRNNNIQYLGIEIRNDLISTAEGIEKFISLLKNSIEYLKNHEDYKNIATLRTNINQPIPKIPEELYESFCI